MIDTYEATQRLILHEGLRLQPYFCSKGKRTIGIGRCLDTNPLTKEEEKVIKDWEHGITKGEAVYLLLNDIKMIETELKQKIRFYKKLDDERQYALLDMAFNLGVFGLLKFKRMLQALSHKNYEVASQECLCSQYAKDVGERAKRIAQLILTGEFKP